VSLCLSLSIWTASLALPNGYEVGYHNGMRYGLFIPPSYNSTKSYPLVVYLHGCTDTVSWDLQWYHDPIQSNDPCFVLTPKTFKEVDWCDAWGTGYMGEHPEDMKNTLEVIDSLTSVFNIDINRLYIYGTSMGGWGVHSVLAKNPGMFAAGIVICGGGNPATAKQVAQTPLWIFHGSADPAVSVERARTMYKAILLIGGTQVRYTEYPGVGHNSWDYALQEPTFYSWLLAQKKGTSHNNPDVAENLKGEALNNITVQLSWNSPSDKANPDNQVWYYNIFRDNTKVAEVDNIDTVYSDQNLTGSTAYSFKISTVNFFFKESVFSDSISVTTLTTSTIDDEIYKDKIMVAPNPVSSIATINIYIDKPMPIIMKVYSPTGQLVRSFEYNNISTGVSQLTFDVTGLSNGFYIANIMTGEKHYIVKIIIDTNK
jgi:predicted esterase